MNVRMGLELGCSIDLAVDSTPSESGQIRLRSAPGLPITGMGDARVCRQFTVNTKSWNCPYEKRIGTTRHVLIRTCRFEPMEKFKSKIQSYQA